MADCVYLSAWEKQTRFLQTTSTITTQTALSHAAQHRERKAILQTRLLTGKPLSSRTFAYKRLVQGLSKALSEFSSFMREFLDRVIQAVQCA